MPRSTKKNISGRQEIPDEDRIQRILELAKEGQVDAPVAILDLLFKEIEPLAFQSKILHQFLLDALKKIQNGEDPRKVFFVSRTGIKGNKPKTKDELWRDTKAALEVCLLLVQSRDKTGKPQLTKQAAYGAVAKTFNMSEALVKKAFLAHRKFVGQAFMIPP